MDKNRERHFRDLPAELKIVQDAGRLDAMGVIGTISVLPGLFVMEAIKTR